MAMMDVAAWALHEFNGDSLGHRARQKRLIQFGAALLQHSNKSVPQLFEGDSHQAKAAYRFLSNSKVTPRGVLAPHTQATVQRARQHPAILAIEDTCVFSLPVRRDTEDFGPINNRKNKTRGWLTHTCLAVAADTLEPLGVLHQHAWVRPKKHRRKKEAAHQRRKRPRESQRWSDTPQAVARVFGRHPHRQEDNTNWSAPRAGTPRIIHVVDREADIFETLETYDALGDSFIVRAAQNRSVRPPADSEGPAYLFPTMETAPSVGERIVAVPGGPGKKARTATLTLRVTEVELLPPSNRGRQGQAQRVTAVLAREEHPPEGVKKPLCWYLLTREPTDSQAAVQAVVSGYTGRWIVEEFHMGLKTGCRLEERQLQTMERIWNFLSLASVVAWQLLALRHAARRPEPLPASAILTPVQLQTLHGLRPSLPRGCSGYQAMRAISRLGGFLGRKSDGEPGWRTLWRGFQELSRAEQGFRAALHWVGQPLPGEEPWT